MFTAVTGVSGSGKSTLVNEILYKAVANKLNRARMRPGTHKRIRGLEQLDKIISVDQSPIGRTPRSNPATYIGLFDQIRDLFSKTQEARARGYKPGRFSFNVKGGRCEVCRGDGQIKIEMHFLPDVYVPCEQCHGKRYNKETLDIRFKGKTIADVLEMPIEEAVEFFAHIPKITRRLQTLHDVGLDYMRLGQPATTLSGGEAQRVKLAAELSKVATGRTLYILDEPTTGLHFADIQRLLEVLQRLVDAGNSVVVIEHNLDVIKTADRIIDMGPEGGEEGGRLMAAGTPEEVAAVEESHTGAFLRELVKAKAGKGGRRRAGAAGAPRAPQGRRGGVSGAAGRRAADRPAGPRAGRRGLAPRAPRPPIPRWLFPLGMLVALEPPVLIVALVPRHRTSRTATWSGSRSSAGCSSRCPSLAIFGLAVMWDRAAEGRPDRPGPAGGADRRPRRRGSRRSRSSSARSRSAPCSRCCSARGRSWRSRRWRSASPRRG